MKVLTELPRVKQTETNLTCSGKILSNEIVRKLVNCYSHADDLIEWVDQALDMGGVRKRGGI